MSVAAQVQFCRQLSTYLTAGVPIVRALESLSRQGPRSLRRISADIVADIAHGSTFGEAVAARPRIFSAYQVALIQAGEQGGSLPESLRRLADGLDDALRFRRQLLLSLLYPLLVYHAGVLIITAVRALLQFSDQGLQFGFYPTAGLLALLLGFGPVYGLVLVAWILGRLSRDAVGLRLALNRLSRLLPVVGSMLHFMAVARFARALESLYSAGIAVPRALGMAADACGRELLRIPLRRAGEAIKAGEEPMVALLAADALPDDALAMLATGFESGRLDEMLLKVAETNEDRARNRARALSIIIPLLLLAAVGALIVYFIITIFAGYVQVFNNELNS